MLSITSSRFKTYVLLVMAMLMYTLSDAQLRRSNIVQEYRAKQRNSEPNVVLINTSTLNDIMVKCIKNGISNVQLVFTRIKTNDDVKEYLTNHTDAKVADVMGKLTVLIKVEGDNLTLDSFLNGTTLNNSLTDAGFRKVDKPYGEIPAIKGVLYLEIGSICPPPNSCSN